MATLNISIDSALREQADNVFAAIGMTTQDAVRMFLRQAVLKQKLPLDTSVSSDLPVTMELNREETMALKEALAHPKPRTPALEEALARISVIPSKVRGLGE